MITVGRGIRQMFGCIILIVVFLIRVVVAQSPPTPSYLLKKVSDTYSKLSHYKLVAIVSYRDPDEGLDLSGFTTIAVRKPDKVRWEVKGGISRFFAGSAFDILSVRDGKTVWTYVPKLKQYKKEDDSEPSESISNLEQLFLDYRSFADKADKAQILREQKLPFNGSTVGCYVVEIRDGPIDIYRLWIDGKRFLVLREDKLSKDDAEGQYYTLSTVFSAIQFGGTVDEQSLVSGKVLCRFQQVYGGQEDSWCSSKKRFELKIGR